MSKDIPIKRATPIFKELYKRVNHWFKYKTPYHAVFLIMGCQRSGTSLLAHVFNELDYTRVFGEFSSLSNQDLDNKIRLNPVNIVNKQLSKIKAPLVFIKPLVESQNAITLLSAIPRSKVIWVYRHYKDVVSSDLKKFKNTGGVGNLIPIVNNDQSNWRAQGTSSETREIIKKHFSEDMSPQVAASLFWYVRNVLFFEQDLSNNSNVYLLNYDSFVQDPTNKLNHLLAENNFPLATQDITNKVFTSSVARAKNIEVPQEIDELCTTLYNRLNQVAEKQ